MNKVSLARQDFRVFQGWTGQTVSQVCLASGAHLDKKVDLCRDRKEMRGSRASRVLQGHLSMWTHQKIFTSREKRVLKALKESVEVLDCRVLTLSQEPKGKKGLWDFLDLGDSLVTLGGLE